MYKSGTDSAEHVLLNREFFRIDAQLFCRSR